MSVGSKLGFHISGFPTDKIYDWEQQAQPKIVKVFGAGGDASEMNLQRLQSVSSALLVYRHYTNLDWHSSSAQDFINEMSEAISKFQGAGVHPIYEFHNEPILSSPQDATLLNSLTTDFANLMHAKGEKVAGFSFSTGNPDLSLVPLLQSSAQLCDYIALHEYFDPLVAQMAMIGRYRQFLNALGFSKPVLITETGLDDGHGQGYQSYPQINYLNDVLAKIDDIYAGDPNLIGSAIFAVGGGKDWKSFELLPIMPQLSNYVATTVPTSVPPPTPPPPPPPPPTPPPPTPPPSMPPPGSGLTIPSDPRLQAYPRPNNDNGIGIHGGLDIRPENIPTYIQWAKNINATWITIAGQDWNQNFWFAQAAWKAGIMPMTRLICKIDHPNDFVLPISIWQKAGIPPYFQIFNEPGDPREWNHKPNIDFFGAMWAQNAIAVFDNGGYPGLQVLGKDEFDAAIGSLRAKNRMDVLQKAFFVLHNAGLNHPMDYPYDIVNQTGLPEIASEFAKHQWTVADLNTLNSIRAAHKNPGATIMTDDSCVLRFLEYKQWMVDAFGFCLPIIGGEAGVAVGDSQDDRYWTVDKNDHAERTVEICNWFSKGVLSNGAPLPDELFSVNFWIESDSPNGWFASPLGPLTDTINAVAAIPPFVRKFTGGVIPTPPPPTPPPPVPPPQPPPQPPPPVPPPPVPGPLLTVSGDLESFPKWINWENGINYKVTEINYYPALPPGDNPHREASELNINIYVKILDSQGNPVNNHPVKFVFPTLTNTNPQNGDYAIHYTRDGVAVFTQSSTFDPGRGEVGEFFIVPGDDTYSLPADLSKSTGCFVGQMGLPLSRHVEYFVIIQMS